MADQWLKCISNTGTIRGVAVQCTDLVLSLSDLHHLKGEHARAYGEALVAGFLLSSYAKDTERMNLNIRGDGWVKQALVDAHPDGTIRGYIVPNDHAVIPSVDLTGEGPWGRGTLAVLRKRDNLEGKNEPYVGTVPLLTGHIAKDLTFYWLQSEQVPSAIGIAVTVDASGKIATAGGFLVQAMPGATDEELREIEAQVNSLRNLAFEISTHPDPIHVLSQIFQDRAFMVLERKELRAECTCSWERVRKALVLIGASELQAMLEETGDAVVKCDFCVKEYRADAETLKAMIKESSS